MIRKLILISLLAVGLILLLIFRPWESKEEKNPRFYDRLPDAELIGKVDLLYLTDLLSKNLYYYNSYLKEFISPDFVLRQGKDYGLDVQKPAYFFLNKGEEPKEFDLGVMLLVNDSTKLGSGLKRIKHIVSLKDTTIENYPFLVNSKEKIHIAYGKDWLLFYMGSHGSVAFNKIINAGKNDITPAWSSFINNPETKKSKFLAETSSKRLQSRGIRKGRITLQNDSTSISILTELIPYDTVSFALKDQGMQMEEKEFTKTLIDIHIHPERIKRNKKDPVYSILKEMGNKISFPVDDFLNAWDGDLAVRQGGYHTIQETYIESEIDDDFNIVEVVKTQDVKVPGLSIYLGVNSLGKEFMRKMYSKGIMTQDGDKQRLLYSPPMNIKHSDSSYLFYTANYKPDIIPSFQNSVMWNFDFMPVSFFLDSVKPTQIYGRVQFPFEHLLKIVSDK